MIKSVKIIYEKKYINIVLCQYIKSASIRDVECSTKQLHQLLLIVGEVSLHDVHAGAHETLENSNFEY